MPFDYGLRLNNRQRIANAREKPIEANKNQSVDGAEGLFLRSGSPQNVYLLPQRPDFSLERCPRPKQICDHPNNEPDKISHPVTASPDSRSTASQIEFATGTGIRKPSQQRPFAESQLSPALQHEGQSQLAGLLDLERQQIVDPRPTQVHRSDRNSGTSRHLDETEARVADLKPARSSQSQRTSKKSSPYSDRVDYDWPSCSQKGHSKKRADKWIDAGFLAGQGT